jgi:hypothetical protein
MKEACYLFLIIDRGHPMTSLALTWWFRLHVLFIYLNVYQNNYQIVRLKNNYNILVQCSLLHGQIKYKAYTWVCFRFTNGASNLLTSVLHLMYFLRSIISVTVLVWQHLLWIRGTYSLQGTNKLPWDSEAWDFGSVVTLLSTLSVWWI